MLPDMSVKRIKTSGGQHHQPEGYNYDVARRAGPLLYVTGMAGIIVEDGRTRAIAGYDDLPPDVAAVFRTGHIGVDLTEEAIVAQAWKTWDGIKGVVEGEGGTLDDILYVTTYLSDRALFPGLTRVRTHFFPETYPPGALVQAEMLAPEILVEIAVVASVPVAP